MNRRSFFQSVSSAVVGVYLGCHVKPIDGISIVAASDPSFSETGRTWIYYATHEEMELGAWHRCRRFPVVM